MKQLSVVVLFSLLSGCNQPQEIATFAALTDRATVEFVSVAHSVVRNCEIIQKTNREKPESIFVTAGPEATANECASSDRAEKALLDSHKVITGYMNTLKLLASDNILITQPADGAIDSLKSGLKISDAQVVALKGLTNAIAKIATDGYRRRELAKMIDMADAPLQAAVTALAEVIEVNIAKDFDATADSLKSYYRRGLRGQDTSTVASILWIEQGEAELAALKEKKEATLGYCRMLKSIAGGHAKLKAANGNFKSAGLVQFLVEAAKSIQAEQLKVERAFASRR